ncbi:hypothetical protein RRG08_066340, partial [Elysia crispata]
PLGVGVNVDPKGGVTGTVSGSHTTEKGVTVSGSVSHGSGGTSGGIQVSIPL